MQTVQRTIVSVKPGQSDLGTAWSDVVGLPAGTQLDLVKVADTEWTVAYRGDMLDNDGVMHSEGEQFVVTSKALKLEI